VVYCITLILTNDLDLYDSLELILITQTLCLYTNRVYKGHMIRAMLASSGDYVMVIELITVIMARLIVIRLYITASGRHQVPRGQLQYIKELGNGWFGKVMICEYLYGVFCRN